MEVPKAAEDDAGHTSVDERSTLQNEACQRTGVPEAEKQRQVRDDPRRGPLNDGGGRRPQKFWMPGPEQQLDFMHGTKTRGRWWLAKLYVQNAFWSLKATKRMERSLQAGDGGR